MNTNKNILFIGGPGEAIPGFGQAKAAGYTVFVTDGNPNAPGLRWAKKYGGGGGVASTYDAEDTLLVARQFPPLGGVLSLACDVGPVVSQVAAALNLPHIPLEITRLSWYKSELKAVLAQAGIAVPGSHFIEYYRDTATLPAANRYVIKANRGRGGYHCFLVESIIEVQNILAELKPELQHGLIVEPFIEGKQLSAEAIVWDGKVVFCGLTDRDYRFNETWPYPVEFGGWGPSELLGEPEDIVLNTIRATIAAIGLYRGTIKFDLVLTSDNVPVVLETAIGRLSGGYSATHYWPLAYNVNFVEMACQIACGQEPIPRQYKPRRYWLQCRGLYRQAKTARSAGERGRFFLAVGKTAGEIIQKVVRWQNA